MKSCLGEVNEEDLLDDYSEEPEELNFDVWTIKEYMMK
jgi:hypothetical protein